MNLVQAFLKQKGLGPPLSISFVSIALVAWRFLTKAQVMLQAQIILQ